MRCVACNSVLGEYGDATLCNECRNIVRMTARGSFREPEPIDWREVVECINTNLRCGIGYLPNTRDE